MNTPPIQHLWTSLWATRFGAEEVRLRFELGGEELEHADQPVPRFLQAHRRASTIADALFSGNCIAVVAWSGQAPDPTGLLDEAEDGFAALQSTGFSSPLISEWRAMLYPDPDGETDAWKLRSYDLGHDKAARDTLLWHAIASEMPIYPSAPVVTFLLDPCKSVMLHVYDDRGMDVIASNPAQIQGLHANFKDWLLAYDRERMAKLF